MSNAPRAIRYRSERLLPPIAAGLVLAADQLTKWLVVRELGPKEASHRYEVVGRLLAFEYVENTGVAFGLLRGQTFLVAVLAVAVVGLLIYIYRSARTTAPAFLVGCGFILGGAAGNLVDRARLGYVVDFVSVSAWPKFNVADSAITLGALALAWTYLRHVEEPSARQIRGMDDTRLTPIALRRERER